MGLEPTHARATTVCVNQLHHVCHNITGIAGLEPTSTVLGTVILPIEIYPYNKMEGSGFEPPNPNGSGFTVRRV